LISDGRDRAAIRGLTWIVVVLGLGGAGAAGARPIVDEPGSIHRQRPPAMPKRTPAPEPAPEAERKPAAPAKAAPEPDPRAEVERQIRAWVEANNRLPDHKDPGAIMRFYTPDYIGTTDGASLDYTELEQQEQVYVDHLKGPTPSPFTIGADITRLEVLAPAVWAEYDSSAERVRDGQVLERYRRKCTGLFVKHGGEWRLKREDCVSPSIQTVPQP